MVNGSSRRSFLRSGLSVGVTGLAGCAALAGNGTESRTNQTEGYDNEDDESITESTTKTNGRPETAEPIDTVRSVGAHYYLWYGAPAYDFHDGRWSRESPSTPILGNYNAADEKVIEQHIDWCHAAGIDWLNVSWLGPDNFHVDDRFRERVLGHPRSDELDWSILYETNVRFESTPVDMDDSENRRQFREDLEYLAERYFHRNVYKRIDGRPVLYIYSAQALGAVGDLVGAYEDAVETIGSRPYLIADISDPSTYGSPAISEVADAVTIYSPYIPRENIEEIFLEQLEQSYKAWYLAQNFAKPDVIPTVIPGFDDSEVTHRPRDHPVLESSPDRYERVCEKTLRYVDGPVFVTSFNEWFENTQIEPSEEHENEYLEITANTLATSTREPPSIEGDILELVFEKTVPEATLNPDLDHGRNLTMVCRRLEVFNDQGDQLINADIGGKESGILFLMGAYERNQSGSRSWRWFGSNRRTIIHFAEVPSRGSLELLGRAAAPMSVTVIHDDEIKGEGTINTDLNSYVIEYG